MSIRYEFNFPEDGTQLIVETKASRERDPGAENQRTPAAWTRLEYCQCSNCPLSKQEVDHCPAAIDMQPIVEDFRSLPGFKKADIVVTTQERQYQKSTGLEEGLRSLMGLVMANSQCPILKNLKPMAYTHLPFATQEEFIVRSVGTYLLRQYFKSHDGSEGDWELEGLISLNRELQMVNQALWQRVHTACEGDSNLKALLSFFTLSSSVSYSLESQLLKLRPAFMADTGTLQPFEHHGENPGYVR